MLGDAAEGLANDQQYGASILVKPEVTGIESLSNTGATYRVLFRTKPDLQWKIAREFRRRALHALTTAGVQVLPPPPALTEQK